MLPLAVTFVTLNVNVPLLFVLGDVKDTVPLELVVPLALPLTIPLHVPVTAAPDFTVPSAFLMVTTALAAVPLGLPERDIVIAET